MAERFSDERLLAYLDERLPVEQMAAVEQAQRTSATIRERLAELARRRDHAGHSVGDVWRRRRLSCPSRRELAAHLLGTLEPEICDYVAFHLNVIGCRLCRANLDDLEQAARAGEEQAERRRRHFATSAGFLREDDEA